MTYVIAQPCVDLKDKACVEECPVDCIYEGDRMLYIHPDECVDCGACEPVCPVEAIFYEDDVPTQWKDYTAANAEFFDDLGSPGGAGKHGLIAKDAAVVAALSRRSTRVTDPRTSPMTRRRPWWWRRVLMTMKAAHDPTTPGIGSATAWRRTPRSHAPRRRGRPVGGHARRPGARRGAGRRWCRVGLAGLPAHRRDHRAARGGSAGWLRARCGVEGSTRPRCSRPSAPRSWSHAAHAARDSGPATPSWCPSWHTRPTTSAPGSPAADVVVSDSHARRSGPARAALVWVNSPSNPTGRVLASSTCARSWRGRRERGALVVSDECYVEFGWDRTPVSVLHPDVCGGLLRWRSGAALAVEAIQSGRLPVGFARGDPWLVAELLEARKNLGMMVPGPVQAAPSSRSTTTSTWPGSGRATADAGSYLLTALGLAGVSVEHSEAGLYLWATRGEPCWETVAWFADRGILVAPGDFYGAAGARHVRIALTATDERIEAAANRLTG